MNPPHHTPSVQQLAWREGSQQSHTQQETHTLTHAYTRKRFRKKRMQIHPLSCYLFIQIADVKPSPIWKRISGWAAEIRYLYLLWRPVTSFCSANTIRSLLHLQCTHRHTCWEPLPFPATTHTTQMSLTLNSGPISHLQWLTVNTGERPSFNRVYGGVSIVSPTRVKLKSMLFGQKMFCISANMSDKICTVKDLLILSVPWHY